MSKLYQIFLFIFISVSCVGQAGPPGERPFDEYEAERAQCVLDAFSQQIGPIETTVEDFTVAYLSSDEFENWGGFVCAPDRSIEYCNEKKWIRVAGYISGTRIIIWAGYRREIELQSVNNLLLHEPLHYLIHAETELDGFQYSFRHEFGKPVHKFWYCVGLESNEEGETCDDSQAVLRVATELCKERFPFDKF